MAIFPSLIPLLNVEKKNISTLSWDIKEKIDSSDEEKIKTKIYFYS